MKTLLVCLGLLLSPSGLLLAQNRLSIAPTYWFSYSKYEYPLYSTTPSITKLPGHDIGSSVGLTLRYQFSPKWDLSAGVLYSKSSSFLTTPQDFELQLTSKSIRLPLLISYRLSDHRLSPYFSAGALLEKGQNFSDAPLETNALIGVGLDYRLNSSFSLLVQPTVSYFLGAQTKNPLLLYNHYRDYSVGLQAQLVWHF